MKEEINILKNKKKQLEQLAREVKLQEFIVETFEMNYERLRIEGGHALSPEVKRQALLQVLMYYRKLKDVAETVTDTEVKLTLPQETTDKGNKFTIEGIVDIIRDSEVLSTTMYDIKTHDCDYVNGHKELYEKQLNVYAHIWQGLRQEELDSTVVIATQFPKSLKKALDAGDESKIDTELGKWDPVINIPFSQEKVGDTIKDFACVVDKIEGSEFEPPSVDVLKERIPGTRQKFATRICRNCDARFSCDSYKNYTLETSSFPGGFSEYISDLGPADEVENWTNTNASESPAPDNVDNLI